MLGIFDLLKVRKNRKCSKNVAPSPRAAIEAMEDRLLLAGNGLAATYFNNADLTGTSVSRTDATVNFNWANGSPNSAIAPDTFSARSTGQIQAAKTQAYTFYTSTDDAA